VVVGGGLAGVAAAVVLAERGVRTTLLERERVLGGRVAAWTDHLASGEPFEMERGFHAFFRQYYNLRALLRRVDPTLAALRPLDDYPILGPGGSVESFSGLPRVPVLNLAVLALRTPSLRWRDFPRIDARTARAMLAFDATRTYAEYDGLSARQYLDALRFPPAARRMLFDVFAHSFFNPEDSMSAAELLMMFHFYFIANPEGLVFDVLGEPFSVAVWTPLARYLAAQGVDVRVGTAVTGIDVGEDGFRVRTDTGAISGDGVVLAVTVPALKAIVDESPRLGDPSWRAGVADLDVTLPFVVLRLWLDRPLAADRAPFAGTTGVGLLDNVSLYERIERESARWAERHRGSVVELHAYAVDPALSEAAVRRDLLNGFHAVYPEAREAGIVEERLLVRRDCPAFGCGSHATRPGVATPTDGLALAGDFVRLDLPTALMERAVTAGVLAANHLLARWGVAGETIWTVPRRGLLARG
jgi:isorenieratene synthase